MKDRRHYWLLLAAVYGLVNSNPKFQTQADDLILSLGLSSLSVVPQLFYLLQEGKLVSFVAKVVDHLLITGVTSHGEEVLEKFDKEFKFGSVVCGHCLTKF